MLLCGFSEFVRHESLVAFKGVMDYNCIPAGSRVLFGLLEHFNPADKHSQQLGGQLRHFGVLLCLLYEFLNILLLQIKLDCFSFEFGQLFAEFVLLGFIAYRKPSVTFGSDSADYSVLIQTADRIVNLSDSDFKLISLLLSGFDEFPRLGSAVPCRYFIELIGIFLA